MTEQTQEKKEHNCNDRPLSFCPECRRLYYIDEEGNRTQIDRIEEGDNF